MVAEKINARDIVVEVSDDDGTTWTEVGGLNSAQPDKSQNEQTAETTTFSDEGHYRQQIMQRGATLTLEGFELKDPSDGSRDAGQKVCEAMFTKVGLASVGKARFRHPMDTEWTVWDATFTPAATGGGNNAESTWGATLTRCGKATTDTVV